MEKCNLTFAQSPRYSKWHEPDFDYPENISAKKPSADTKARLHFPSQISHKLLRVMTETSDVPKISQLQNWLN